MEKARKLLEEAKTDLSVGCFNKSASASYFAARMIVEIFLRSRNLLIPRRDDKLANLFESQGFEDLSNDLRRLYDLRKKADYLGKSVDRKEAEKAVRLANNIVDVLTEMVDSKIGRSDHRNPLPS